MGLVGSPWRLHPLTLPPHPPCPQDGYVSNASSVVQQGQTVRVRVMSADPSTGRVALSMKGMSGGWAVVQAAWRRCQWKHTACTLPPLRTAA